MINRALKNACFAVLLLTLVTNLVPVVHATTGAVFKVGIIDTGIDYNHAYLKDNVEDSCSENFIENTSGKIAANDTDGHGTRVAGLIGAKLNTFNGMSGLNPMAQLCSLKVFANVGDFTPTISSATESRIVNAINYAAEKGIRLINMSWGSYVSSEAIKQAIASHPDILFVAAAGDSNDSQLNVLPLAPNGMNVFNNNDLKPFYPASYIFNNLISVTSSDFSNKLFGNYGTVSVDLAALGLGVETTDRNNSYGYFDGTYLSSARVTGAAPYLWGLNQGEASFSVKSKVLASTDKTRFMAGVTLTSGILNLNNLLNGNYTSVLVQ